MKTKPINLHEHEAIAAAKGELRKVFRIVKPQPKKDSDIAQKVNGGALFYAAQSKGGFRTDTKICPFGVVGDRLRSREAWYSAPGWRGGQTHSAPIGYVADGEPPHSSYSKRSSIHMPLLASRFLFSIEDISVMRIQDVTEEDAGLAGADVVPLSSFFVHPNRLARFILNCDSVHGKDAWNRNDWVWALTLKDVR